MKDWNIQINYGIKTGFNDAFIIDSNKRDELIKKCPKAEQIIRPILRGRDIQKYKADWQGLYIIGTFPSLDLDIDDFPEVKKYLLSFGKERLEQSGEKGARKKTNNKWFETQDSISYWEDFFRPKIIYPNMTKFLPFYYDTNSYFTNQKCFIITGENISFLTAFLNSSLFKFCFKENFPELQGGTRELSKVFFDKISVIKVSNQQNDFFEKRVQKIQKLKLQNKDTTELEIEIDEAIFDLYKLSNEERKAIGFVQIT